MTGKRYYLTTVGNWKRRAHALSISHWAPVTSTLGLISKPNYQADQTDDATVILVLIEADEAMHNDLEDDSAFEPLPHPFSPKDISPAAKSILAKEGLTSTASTLDIVEAISQVHPLLRHTVF